MNTSSIRFLKACALSALLMLPLNVLAQHDQQRERRGAPPPQALTACEDAEMGAVCDFVGRRDETVTGTCVSIPEINDAGLACKPNGGHKPRRRSGD